MTNPRVLIAAGLGLMVVGVLLPYLIIMKVLESTFLLNFIAYGAQVLGLVLGMVGVGFFAVSRRRKK